MKVLNCDGILKDIAEDWGNKEYQQWLEREKRYLESLTPQEICWTLKYIGIEAGSRDERDYLRARQVILKDIPINSSIRENHIKTIADYVGV